tara:strand:+ start:25707 stop:26558 length:852 start_codon:yes stop_codon:yes gene_type:complete
MEKIKKKVLVIGSTGMLGHVLCHTLYKSDKYQVFNIARKSLNSETIIIDVTDINKLKIILNKISPNYIINCIGLLVSDSKENTVNAIKLNSLFPHQLKEIADKLGSSVIQISTDCVFDGKTGNYTEKSNTCPSDIYGKTKLLGEIYDLNHTTIRTSIIGPELNNNSRGLFSWILKNKESNIEGYTKSIWSGITTIELSKSIIYCIENSIFGLLHVFKQPISKYELISLIDIEFGLNLKIKRVEGKISDKSLISLRTDYGYTFPSYKEMISEMKSFIKLNKNLY